MPIASKCNINGSKVYNLHCDVDVEKLLNARKWTHIKCEIDTRSAFRDESLDENWLDTIKLRSFSLSSRKSCQMSFSCFLAHLMAHFMTRLFLQTLFFSPLFLSLSFLCGDNLPTVLDWQSCWWDSFLWSHNFKLKNEWLFLYVKITN